MCDDFEWSRSRMKSKLLWREQPKGQYRKPPYGLKWRLELRDES
jgi:hypothetical protein